MRCRIGPALGAVAAMLITGCGTSSGQAQGTVVTATETEYKIVLSRASFTPGTYTFVATNHGQLTHSLEIKGPGVNGQQLPQLLAPGQSGSMTVTLRQGTYDVFCQAGRHKQLGMNVIIQVTGTAGATTAQTGPAPRGPTVKSATVRKFSPRVSAGVARQTESGPAMPCR